MEYGWVAKLITALGTFDTYKGGVQGFEFARVGLILTIGEYRFMKLFK